MSRLFFSERVSGFFHARGLPRHAQLSFLVGCVGAPARVRRYLCPVFQPHTACHPRLEAGAAGSQPVDKEPFMANTAPMGRIAPASKPSTGNTPTSILSPCMARPSTLARWPRTTPARATTLGQRARQCKPWAPCAACNLWPPKRLQARAPIAATTFRCPRRLMCSIQW